MFRRVWPRWRAATPILPTNRFLFARQFRTSQPRLTTTDNPTVSQRLKLLVRSYGWYALGVYLVFSALDFTVAFVGINLLGAEQVSHATAYLRQTVAGLLRKTPEPGSGQVEDTPAGNGSHDGLYAMLALAYTIHKTVFLPVRVGLTAALTPRIVGWLRARGWAKRAVKEANKGPR